MKWGWCIGKVLHCILPSPQGGSLGVKYRKQEVAPRKDMLCGLLQLLFVYTTCTVKGRVPRVSPGGGGGGLHSVKHSLMVYWATDSSPAAWSPAWSSATHSETSYVVVPSLLGWGQLCRTQYAWKACGRSVWIQMVHCSLQLSHMLWLLHYDCSSLH